MHAGRRHVWLRSKPSMKRVMGPRSQRANHTMLRSDNRVFTQAPENADIDRSINGMSESTSVDGRIASRSGHTRGRATGRAERSPSHPLSNSSVTDRLAYDARGQKETHAPQ